MTPRLPAYASRALAVSIAVAILGGTWMLIVRPVLDLGVEIRDELTRATERRNRLEASTAEAQSLASGKIDIAGYAGDFLQGESDAVIVAELQKQIGSIVAATGSELSTAQPVPPRTDGAHQKLGLRVQIRGSLDAVQRILYTIETARPYLFIERAVLRVDPTPRVGGHPTGLAAIRMTADLDIVGARLVSVKPSPRP